MKDNGGCVKFGSVFLVAFLQRPGGNLADRSRPVALVVADIVMSGLAVAGVPPEQKYSRYLVINIPRSWSVRSGLNFDPCVQRGRDLLC